MKKHKPKMLPPLFKKERDMLNIVSHPEKLQQLKEIADTMRNASEKMVKPKDLDEWHMYVLSILPEFEGANEFTEKLGTLINEYTNERKGSNPAESC